MRIFGFGATLFLGLSQCSLMVEPSDYSSLGEQQFEANAPRQFFQEPDQETFENWKDNHPLYAQEEEEFSNHPLYAQEEEEEEFSNQEEGDFDLNSSQSENFETNRHVQEADANDISLEEQDQDFLENYESERDQESFDQESLDQEEDVETAVNDETFQDDDFDSEKYLEEGIDKSAIDALFAQDDFQEIPSFQAAVSTETTKKGNPVLFIMLIVGFVFIIGLGIFLYHKRNVKQDEAKTLLISTDKAVSKI